MGTLSHEAERMIQQPAVLPPSLTFMDTDEIAEVETVDPDAPAQAIAGFVCVIEYADVHGEVSERLILCRRYELFDGNPIVGAICSKSHRYKQFRCDRILEVTDATTGESLGDGRFFEQFVVGAIREKVDTWNTTSRRKALIVAGLNVLCFIARCDGVWHYLEEQVIEDFVCCLWMRKEWEGEPPLDRIMAHARRLAPDGDVFRTSIRQYAHSSTSSTILTRFVHRVIAADGVISIEEHVWASRYAELLEDAKAEERRQRANWPSEIVKTVQG